MFTATFNTGMGKGFVFWTADGLITRIILPGENPPLESGAVRESPGGHPILAVLEAYFQGHEVLFNFPCRLEGTAFQQKIWKALTAIPYGRTSTYQETAEAAGFPRAARAVGAACAANKLPILFPCHRVLRTGGGLGGYSGGVKLKRYLLELEGVKF